MAKFIINSLLFVIGVACVLAAPTPQTPIVRTTPSTSTVNVTLNKTTLASTTQSSTTPVARLSTSIIEETTTALPTTTTDDIAADIADLFVANQNFGALEMQAEGDLTDGDAAASTTVGDEPALIVTSSSPISNVDINTSAVAGSTTTEPTDPTDSTELDDALFDVIIDDGGGTAADRTAGSTTGGNTGSETSDGTETPPSAGRLPPRQVLEVDSEEFFVPADIKERETTTSAASTTTEANDDGTVDVLSKLPTTMALPSIMSSTMDPSTTLATTTDIPSTSTVASISSSSEKIITTEIAINPDTSDTIFYISNTEVKVGESPADLNAQPPPPSLSSSMPSTPSSPAIAPVNPPRQSDTGTKKTTANNKQQTNEELQFFPASYDEDVIIDVRRENSTLWHSGVGPDRYEEDLIISQSQSKQQLQKHEQQKHEQRHKPTENDGDLSISYVGESYIEVKEFARDQYGTVAPFQQQEQQTLSGAGSSSNNYAEYVIIQPIVEAPTSPIITSTAEPPIGVPVIEELPPALIREYAAAAEAAAAAAASSGAASDPRDDLLDDEEQEDNEILPPLPRLRSSPALIQNPDSNTANVERHRLVNGPNDDATATIVVLDNGGGEKTTSSFVLSDWLNGVFGKGLPAKRNNNNVGSVAVGSDGGIASGVHNVSDTATASAVSATQSLNSNGSALNATNATRADSAWKGSYANRKQLFGLFSLNTLHSEFRIDLVESINKSLEYHRVLILTLSACVVLIFFASAFALYKG